MGKDKKKKTLSIPPENPKLMQKGSSRTKITIGNNNEISTSVVIADVIENSFTTLDNAQIDTEVRILLKQLIKAIIEVDQKVPPKKLDYVETMVRDVETLVKEATSSRPRRQWYDVSIEGLKNAAINIGEGASPVVQIVEKLKTLLTPDG